MERWGQRELAVVNRDENGRVKSADFINPEKVGLSYAELHDSEKASRQEIISQVRDFYSQSDEFGPFPDEGDVQITLVRITGDIDASTEQRAARKMRALGADDEEIRDLFPDLFSDDGASEEDETSEEPSEADLRAQLEE